MAEKGRIEGLIEAAKVWVASVLLNPIAVGTSKFVLIRTPEGDNLNTRIALDMQVAPLYQSVVYLYENPDISAAGVSMTPYNMNRNFTGAPTKVQAFYNPTIGGGGNGTELDARQVPEGSSFAGIHGAVFDPDREWVLKPSEDYLIRIANTSAIASFAYVSPTWTEKVIN